MAVARHNLTRRAVLGAGAGVAVAATGIVTPAGAAEQVNGAMGEAPISSFRVDPSVDIVCAGCGGASVTRDAWAEWDAESQQWVLGAVFDDAFCHDCETEARLEEVASDASYSSEPSG